MHGEFLQSPEKHITRKQGCPLCAKEYNAKVHTKNIDYYLDNFKKIHNDIYDYSLAKYKGYNKKIEIICPKHGSFWQTVNCHMQGKGCPRCSESKLEKEINNLLVNNNIYFIRQFSDKWLDGLILDFYLPQYNVAIECQGIQHFQPRDFSGHNKELSEKLFSEIQKRDLKKLKLCNNNNIKLIYYSNLKINYPYEVYEDKNKIIEIIQKESD